MCGISVLHQKSPVEGSDVYLKHRGPDLFNSIKEKGFLMMHHLLHLTGEFTKQPVHDGGIYCLFNGEIYNYKDFGDLMSDSYCIIEAYKKHGDSFVRELDGEFALFLIDFNKNVFFISSDVFGIKPIYYSVSNGFGLSSYSSFLSINGFGEITRLEPNTTLKFSLDFNLISQSTVYDFDLHQHKTDFNDWDSAFIESISKRFIGLNYKIILPLSSGHDSGAIACAMNKLGIEYISYSYLRNEDSDIIRSRLNINKNQIKVIDSEPIDINELKSSINKNCEPFYYGYHYSSHQSFGFDDPGALGLYNLLRRMKAEHPDLKVLASGQGSDEIMSNLQAYKFRRSNPVSFPDNLGSVFPWENFYHGAQSSYLSKEECITGAFGIEGRYPFLDKKVVQEFLYLSADMKNSSFKSATFNFLSQNGYPHNSVKRGFNPS